MTFRVVFVERGQRKILVNYAKRQVGNKVYGGQSSHLPLKLNMSGVIPPIFASSIILLPAPSSAGSPPARDALAEGHLGDAVAGQPIYVLLYAAMIVFFCFFYTALVFNSRETADNLKKMAPSSRASARASRLRVHRQDPVAADAGRCGLHHVVCLLPEFLVLKYNVPFLWRHLAADHRGGHDGLLGQVQSYVMSQQYESLLKKANFKAS